MKTMKHALHAILTAVFLLPATLSANTAPTVVIQSAAMRPGTTLMDVVFRVNDPDDATVKTRALAFVDGVRSFANVIKPVAFVEGTAAKLGDAIPANVDHTITWDVAADWDVQLGQIKFEVLAMDSRGLLPFDWITIPATAGKPALTISKDTPADASALSAFFWQYAAGDTGLTLINDLLTGSASSGNFTAVSLVSGTLVQTYGIPYLFKQTNLDPVSSSDVNYAAATARAGILSTGSWHAANRSYGGLQVLASWGSNSSGQTNIPAGLTGVTAIAAGDYHSLALKSDGTVVRWGSASAVPAGLTGVTAIAAGYDFSLALKNDGTVVGWGSNSFRQTTIPAGLTGVTAIAAGGYFSLALKNDGTVVGWGMSSQTTIPAGLTGVTAITAGRNHSLALKNDGRVVGWGSNSSGVTTIPSGLTGVTAIAAGSSHSLALKNDGTVVGWGSNSDGQTTIPAGLTGVTAIAAGDYFNLALKNDGTVVGWGRTPGSTVPTGLTGVTAISAGYDHSLTFKPFAP